MEILGAVDRAGRFPLRLSIRGAISPKILYFEMCWINFCRKAEIAEKLMIYPPIEA